MSALLLHNGPRLEPQTRRAALDFSGTGTAKGQHACRAGLAGEQLTLERVVEDAWTQLVERGTTRCPVCGGTMRRTRPLPYGKCAACGSTLR